MLIHRLRLTNYKRHQQLDLELRPGLNVVRGPNEAGKSTIQRAIEMGLFRRPTFASQELEELQPWQAADPETDPMIEIEFEHEGRRGSLRKVFAGSRGIVELELGDEKLTDPAAVEKRVAELTGLASEKFFRATASIHHQELTGLTQDEATLRDRLQQSMSGADRGTHAARRKLEEAVRRYRTEGAKNPGYLKVHRAEVERLEGETQRGQAALAALEADRRTLASARHARATLEVQYVEQQDNLARAERAVVLGRRAAEASRRYTHYKRAVELREELARLDGSHPSDIPLATLRGTVERLRDLEFRLSEMRAELAAEPDLSGYDTAIPSPRWKPWMVAGGALLVGAALMVALAVAGGLGLIGFAIAAALVAGGVFGVYQGYGQRRRLADIRMQNELRESEIARRLAGRTHLADRVGQIELERSAGLSALGVSELSAAESLLAAESEHSAQIASRTAEYRGLMGEEAVQEDVTGQRDAAAAELDECRHTLAGMGELGRDPERHLATYRNALQRLGPEREAAISAEAQAEARLAANDIDAERVAADQEALATAREALGAAERRLRIYEETLRTLNNAERATMKKAARFLEQRMARDVERVTGGRYRRLKVDEATLSFTLFSPELDEWVDVRRLSQGTLDQLYLCARLGIVHQVTQDADPPLVLDDPFVTFDDDRAHRSLELLRDIARESQVILLTVSDRYDAQADHVVILPAPVERDELDRVATDAGAEPIAMWSAADAPPAAKGDRRVVSGNGAGRGQQPAPAAAASSTAEGLEPAPLWPEER